MRLIWAFECRDEFTVIGGELELERTAWANASRSEAGSGEDGQELEGGTDEHLGRWEWCGICGRPNWFCLIRV